MTTNPTALREAIARLERGEVGREVDAKIALAAGWANDKWGYWSRPDGRQSPGYASFPAFTASIDAAETLIPPAYEWVLASARERYKAVAWQPPQPTTPPIPELTQATPATALCLAALRARLAMMEAS